MAMLEAPRINAGAKDDDDDHGDDDGGKIMPSGKEGHFDKGVIVDQKTVDESAMDPQSGVNETVIVDDVNEVSTTMCTVDETAVVAQGGWVLTNTAFDQFRQTLRTTLDDLIKQLKVARDYEPAIGDTANQIGNDLCELIKIEQQYHGFYYDSANEAVKKTAYGANFLKAIIAYQAASNSEILKDNSVTAESHEAGDTAQAASNTEILKGNSMTAESHEAGDTATVISRTVREQAQAIVKFKAETTDTDIVYQKITRIMTCLKKLEKNIEYEEATTIINDFLGIYNFPEMQDELKKCIKEKLGTLAERKINLSNNGIKKNQDHDNLMAELHRRNRELSGRFGLVRKTSLRSSSGESSRGENSPRTFKSPKTTPRSLQKGSGEFKPMAQPLNRSRSLSVAEMTANIKMTPNINRADGLRRTSTPALAVIPEQGRPRAETVGSMRRKTDSTGGNGYYPGSPLAQSAPNNSMQTNLSQRVKKKGGSAVVSTQNTQPNPQLLRRTKSARAQLRPVLYR